jgi:hypothetical protein
MQQEGVEGEKREEKKGGWDTWFCRVSIPIYFLFEENW